MKVSSRINIEDGSSLLLVARENTSRYVICSVLKITGDDPHCSYVNYSRDAIGTWRFWFPKSNLQMRYLKRVINICWDSRWVLEGSFKSTGDWFMLTVFGIGSREKTNRRLTKIEWWYVSGFHNPPSSLNYTKKLENLHMVVIVSLVLSSHFWGSWAETPHHPNKQQASSWLLPFILKDTTDLGPVMLHCVFVGCAYVCNQPSKSTLAPVWMRIAIMSEVKAVLVPWFMYACMLLAPVLTEE